MGDASINGDMPSSQTLSHIIDYPLVKQTKSIVESNSLGKTGIDLANSFYGTFFKPFLPYLQTPISYAKPYAEKADQIGDSVLTKFDEKIPVLKKEPAELQSTAQDIAFYPLNQAKKSLDYGISTYKSEYNKCGGDGVVAAGKAAITTNMMFISDGAGWLSSFLSQKKEQGKKVVAEKTNN